MNFKDFLYIIEEKNLYDMLPDIDLPTIVKTSRIKHLYDKKNPIIVLLDDGTKLYFTYDEFRRIEGTPEVGKKLTYTMQRLAHDKTIMPSKITKCVVS